MTIHKQITLKAPWGDTEVDEGIAELLSAIWDRDIFTIMSCEDNTPAGWMWIDFATSTDAAMFCQCNGLLSKDWAYSVSYWPNKGYFGDDTVYALMMPVSIRFPREQYEQILANVREYPQVIQKPPTNGKKPKPKTDDLDRLKRWNEMVGKNS